MTDYRRFLWDMRADIENGMTNEQVKEKYGSLPELSEWFPEREEKSKKSGKRTTHTTAMQFGETISKVRADVDSEAEKPPLAQALGIINRKLGMLLLDITDDLLELEPANPRDTRKIGICCGKLQETNTADHNTEGLLREADGYLEGKFNERIEALFPTEAE